MSHRYDAIVIGASAGAFEALSVLLPNLPSGYRLPIMAVIHLPPDKKSVMVDLLRSKCKVEVQEAEDKMPIQHGNIYLAPPDYHLLVEKDRRLSLSSDEQVHYSRPSIDVLFETAADAYGPRLIGIVLTGANSDGARGLAAVMDAGGVGLVQDPEFAFASAMPREALKACKSARILSLEQIATFLREDALL